MNAYEILGVDRNHGLGEIRRAYHRLAKLHHPDRGGSVRDFVRVRRAYEELLDHLVAAHPDGLSIDDSVGLEPDSNADAEINPTRADGGHRHHPSANRFDVPFLRPRPAFAAQIHEDFVMMALFTLFCAMLAALSSAWMLPLAPALSWTSRFAVFLCVFTGVGALGAIVGAADRCHGQTVYRWLVLLLTATVLLGNWCAAAPHSL